MFRNNDVQIDKVYFEVWTVYHLIDYLSYPVCDVAVVALGLFIIY